MNVRLVGIVAGCAAIVGLGSPSGASPAAPVPGAAGLLARPGAQAGFAGFEGAGAVAPMLRRQRAPVSPRTTALRRRVRKGTISFGGRIFHGFVRGSSALNGHSDTCLGY